MALMLHQRKPLILTGVPTCGPCSAHSFLSHDWILPFAQRTCPPISLNQNFALVQLHFRLLAASVSTACSFNWPYLLLISLNFVPDGLASMSTFAERAKLLHCLPFLHRNKKNPLKPYYALLYALLKCPKLNTAMSNGDP